LSYGLTPSALARGTAYMARLIVRCNISIALRYHEIVNSLNERHCDASLANWPGDRPDPGLMLDGLALDGTPLVLDGAL